MFDAPFSSPAKSASFSDSKTTKQPFALIIRGPVFESEIPSNGSAPKPDGRSMTAVPPSLTAPASVGTATMNDTAATRAHHRMGREHTGAPCGCGICQRRTTVKVTVRAFERLPAASFARTVAR
jgi:hypothetical protein